MCNTGVLQAQDVLYQGTWSTFDKQLVWRTSRGRENGAVGCHSFILGLDCVEHHLGGRPRHVWHLDFFDEKNVSVRWKISSKLIFDTSISSL